MAIHRLSRPRYIHSAFWALLVCAIIVSAFAALGRSTLNFKAALTDKPDIAIYLLLPDEGLGHTELLRETEDQRDYLAETKDGSKLVILKKGEEEWYVDRMEELRE
jgi:hypothetical protein